MKKTLLFVIAVSLLLAGCASTEKTKEPLVPAAVIGPATATPTPVFGSTATPTGPTATPQTAFDKALAEIALKCGGNASNDCLIRTGIAVEGSIFCEDFKRYLGTKTRDANATNAFARSCNAVLANRS